MLVLTIATTWSIIKSAIVYFSSEINKAYVTLQMVESFALYVVFFNGYRKGEITFIWFFLFGSVTLAFFGSLLRKLITT